MANFLLKHLLSVIAACSRGDVASVRALLQQIDGYHKILLDNDLWLKVPSSFTHTTGPKSGDRPVHCAARFGQLAVVRLLVEEFNEPFVSVQNSRGGLPVHIAAQEGHLAVVEYFLKKAPHLIKSTDKGMRTPLIFAADFGRVDVVQFLIGLQLSDADRRQVIEWKDKQGRTALMMAVIRGHGNIVRLLVSKAGADFRVRSGAADLFSTPALMSAEFGHCDILLFLLSLDPALINDTDSDGDRPLNRAAAAGHDKIVEKLISFDISSIEHKGFTNRTPLLQSSANGHLGIAKILVTTGADIEARDSSENGDSAIHLAAFFGKSDIVSYLLAIKPELLENRNGQNSTPLCRAVGGEKFEIVKYLVECKNASVNCRFYPKSMTPLMLAVYRGNQPIVRFLCENGADLTAQSDVTAWTALHIAARFGLVEIAAMLTETLPALVAMSTANKDLAIHIAAGSGHLQVVEHLLACDDSLIEARGQNGLTPLMTATICGQLHVVKALVGQGARISAKSNPFGWTALHLASQNCYAEILDYFLGLRPDLLESKTNDGDTVLNVALFCWKDDGSSFRFVRNLIETKGCNLNNRGQSGKTPLMIAAQLNNAEAANLLIENGAVCSLRDSTVLGDTALHLAVKFGSNNTVECLLQTEPLLAELTNNMGHTPLFYAIQMQHQPIVDLLTAGNANAYRRRLIFSAVITRPLNLLAEFDLWRTKRSS